MRFVIIVLALITTSACEAKSYYRFNYNYDRPATYKYYYRYDAPKYQAVKYA